MDSIVGILWNKNEGDILEEVILKALPKVDSLLCADDGSDDNSWEIMQSLHKKYPDKIEHIQRNPTKQDPAQRQALLNQVRKRYKPEDTWVHVIESDLIIIDTDIREALKKYAHENCMMNWFLFNGIRDNWDGIDTYPNWDMSIQEILYKGHYMEQGPWTWRPLPKVSFNKDLWRPWPQGFSHYMTNSSMRAEFYKKLSNDDIPIMGHYGYRGPTHIYNKFSSKGIKKHSKYKTWNFESVASTAATLPYFDGTYAKGSFILSRQGYIDHINSGGRT